jgi:hypothetical protein
VLGFDTYRFNRFIADWLVENMNLDVISYGISFDVRLWSKGKKEKKYIFN